MYGLQTNEEVQVVWKGQTILLVGTGEWSCNPVGNLDSFTAALSALHTKQGINDVFVEACSRCEEIWNRSNTEEGCDLHPSWCQKRRTGNVVTAELFISAKKYLQVYHENNVLPELMKKARENDVQASPCNATDNGRGSNGHLTPQTRRGPAQPAATMGHRSSVPHPGTLVTPPLATATTPSKNHAATSNAFVLHHMHRATHGSPHSAILLQSLISLMDVKGEEAAERVKWEEETKNDS